MSNWLRFNFRRLNAPLPFFCQNNFPTYSNFFIDTLAQRRPSLG